MPLIAHSSLPSFNRLEQEGQEVLSVDTATHQDIREIHIGICNMMPDAALEATERQFLRMVGACNRIVQFYVHLFSFPEIPRGKAASEHIANHYSDFEELKQQGLDALIITGANPVQSVLQQEPFWQPLERMVHWAKDNVCSVMCSCLATHAIVEMLWDIKRYKLPYKRWGVYSHRLNQNVFHPLVSGINTRFDAPHSHVYEVNSQQLEQKGLYVLAKGKESDFHLGASPDGFQFIFFQGHPEYDVVSLLKEFKREVARYLNGIHDNYPRFPENYFNKQAIDILKAYEQLISTGEQDISQALAAFPEQALMQHIDNTWSDTGKAIVNNWLGLVYQLTSIDRAKPYSNHVDPNNPLGLKNKEQTILKQ